MGAWAPEVARVVLEIGGIQAVVLLTYQLLMRRFLLPRFLADMFAVIGYAGVLFTLLSRLGVNVTGLIATSAVATAVIGLSLQELLSNLASGISLGLEKEIGTGTWISTEFGSGHVNHMRLRHTSITTRDGEIILIPNSVLTKSPVTMILRNRRRMVKFAHDYRCPPSRVIEAVEEALAVSPVTWVAAEPKPTCLVLGFEKSHIEYGIQIWVTNPNYEKIATSAVLIRIYFALARISAPLRPVVKVLDIHSERPVAADRKLEGSEAIASLRKVALFRALTDDEITQLAARLKRLAFAPGETILRQGDEGGSMFLLVAGRASVLLTNEAGLSQEVRVLKAGDFLGEMSLLTGEKRSATVLAVDQVDCLRLDKADLYDLLNARSEIADDMSLLIAERQVELAGIREQLDLDSSARRIVSTRDDMLGRIKRFFGLPD